LDELLLGKKSLRSQSINVWGKLFDKLKEWIVTASYQTNKKLKRLKVDVALGKSDGHDK
jgi:hypothetical protein